MSYKKPSLDVTRKAIRDADHRDKGIFRHKRPKRIPPDQEYFWSDEWQAGEREADEDIAAGRVHRFETMDEAIDWLNSDDEE